MLTTRYKSKVNTAKDSLRDKAKDQSRQSDYKSYTLQEANIERSTKDVHNQSSLISNLLPSRDNKRKRKGTLVLSPLGARTNTVDGERTTSRPNISNDQSSSSQRREGEKPADSSDNSLPDINDLLFGIPDTLKRIEEGAKRKFNLVTNRKDAFSEDSITNERLLSAADNELLSSICNKIEREERERELLKRELKAEKVKVMWMEAEVAKWQGLAHRSRTGGEGRYDDWSSRQGAFEELYADLEGWKAAREECSSDED